MTEFNTTAKSGRIYLDLAANGNGDEKAALTMESMRRLARVGTLNQSVIEVGPGGGSSTKSITDAFERGDFPGVTLDLSFVEIDDVESDSLKEARKRIEQFATTNLHRGNLKYLSSVIDNEVNVVAASAVLHEVYSYSGGYDAINKSVGEIAVSLASGGFFAYRDVLSSEKRSIHERTRHFYDKEAWVRFSKLFLEHYLDHAVHPYHRHEDQVVFEQNSKRVDLESIDSTTGLSISAPVGLLREIQRHYITLRDYIWRSGTLGVSPVLDGPKANDWLDIRQGHKRVHFTIDRQDPLLESLSELDGDGGRVVDGDIFDATTDVLLGEFLREVSEDITGKSGGIWSEWLSREGSETYNYMTTSNFIGVTAIESFTATNGTGILLPVKLNDVLAVPRAYYNRFLEGQLSNPLKDGKQLVLFESLDLSSNSASSSDKISEALSTISEHCSKETLANIYTTIRKSL